MSFELFELRLYKFLPSVSSGFSIYNDIFKNIKLLQLILNHFLLTSAT